MKEEARNVFREKAMEIAEDVSQRIWKLEEGTDACEIKFYGLAFGSDWKIGRRRKTEATIIMQNYTTESVMDAIYNAFGGDIFFETKMKVYTENNPDRKMYLVTTEFENAESYVDDDWGTYLAKKAKVLAEYSFNT